MEREKNGKREKGRVWMVVQAVGERESEATSTDDVQRAEGNSLNFGDITKPS